MKHLTLIALCSMAALAPVTGHADNALDLVGTIVGVVDRAEIIDGRGVTAGDAVIGLQSSGLHTNGFTLARSVVAGRDLASVPEGLDAPLGEVLLRPHRSYLGAVERLGAQLGPLLQDEGAHGGEVLSELIGSEAEVGGLGHGVLLR